MAYNHEYGESKTYLLRLRWSLPGTIIKLGASSTFYCYVIGVVVLLFLLFSL